MKALAYGHECWPLAIESQRPQVLNGGRHQSGCKVVCPQLRACSENINPFFLFLGSQSCCSSYRVGGTSMQLHRPRIQACTTARTKPCPDHHLRLHFTHGGGIVPLAKQHMPMHNMAYRLQCWRKCRSLELRVVTLKAPRRRETRRDMLR